MGGPSHSNIPFAKWRALNSLAQIEPNAKSTGNLLSSSLITDQVARRGGDRRLPAKSMVLANNNFQANHTDLLGDHVGKLRTTSAFLKHGESLQMRSAPDINRPKNSEGTVNEYG
jgi:hypothetical protein